MSAHCPPICRRSLQVAIQLTIKPLSDTFKQNILPRIFRWLRPPPQPKTWLEGELIKRQSDGLDHDLIQKEYSTKVIAYGLVVLFAVAMPLAPLILLLTNILDVRLDSCKFTEVKGKT